MDTFVTVVKQYPGQQQVTRRVRVKVPGKHFPQLQPAEQTSSYWGEAVESKERHVFPRHPKAWGSAHTGPGIRFICDSDAIDDPNTKGFWTTLLLWNRWRHDTYKDDSEAEKQYLDELPTAPAAAANAAPKEKEPPEIKKHFTIVSTGIHTFGGAGRLSGTTAPFSNYACNRPGCPRGATKPIKQVGSATGQLFIHLDACQPALCLKIRAASKHSPVEIDDNGEEYVLYSFKELLPHHVRFVQKCFRGFDHFYETRADNGLLEYVRGFDKRANLPHEQTCQRLLEVHEELVDEMIAALIDRHMQALGVPCCGSTCDIWSLSSCRESFGCLRGAFVLDGDIVAQVTGHVRYAGTLVDMSPLLGFARFEETSHTGAAIARWKTAVFTKWKLQAGAVGLATEDGASPNKKANKILGQDMAVCSPHDIARAVLIASGEEGKPCKNPELKALTARSSKQGGSFHRSVNASKALQQAQLDADPELKESRLMTTKTKNKTRWLGLWAMCNRNRVIGKEIRIALTGDEQGECAERLAPVAMRIELSDASDDDSGDESSDGEAQEEGNRAASKSFPLAHRCLSMEEFRATDVFESLLDRPREVTLLVQSEAEGWGEGLDIGVTWLTIKEMRDEAMADRVEIVSGRGELETWKEANASSLAPMFKIFRKEFAAQLTTRNLLNSIPSKHVLLALKMNPSINTDSTSTLFDGKSAMEELMIGEYKRALRRQCILLEQNSIAVVPPPAQATAGTAAGAEAGAAQGAGAVEETQPATAPAPKRRKGLLGSVASKQTTLNTLDAEVSKIDAQVQVEVERFSIISAQIISNGMKDAYYQGTSCFNLRTFWADHKKALPLHFAVYLAEVGCKKSAAANVESIFSGAGKFTDEAGSAGHVLLSRIVRLHYHWKYDFLRPTVKQVEDRYNAKYHEPSVAQHFPAAQTAGSPTADVADASPAAPEMHKAGPS